MSRNAPDPQTKAWATNQRPVTRILIDACADVNAVQERSDRPDNHPVVEAQRRAPFLLRVVWGHTRPRSVALGFDFPAMRVQWDLNTGRTLRAFGIP